MASASPITSPEFVTSSVIATRFAQLAASGLRALVCYVTAGHPDRERSLALIRGLEQAGADIIEIGVPFSDPLADGPAIQRSSQIAIDAGMTLNRTLELIADARVNVPIVLFSYLNPLIAGGPDVLERAKAAGVHGVLVTDLPVGADPEREAWFGASGLDFVRLVAPTTPLSRMREISRHGGGFIYLISRMGVTGARDTLAADLPETVARLRAATTLPLCIGFGISTPAQAAAVAQLGDGVIVGSAIVTAAERSVAEALALTASLRAAIDAA
ncbi:MAG: tryptophan synthase subunit alpha [Gemmatimonadaceae bacterium]|nr:tryptophan synthase subunit alpha [Gemmatimonadaceae bacterium]